MIRISSLHLGWIVYIDRATALYNRSLHNRQPQSAPTFFVETKGSNIVASISGNAHACILYGEDNLITGFV